MSHPSARQLEAAAFGWLAEAEAQQIRAHAANCPKCGPVLREEESVHRRLGLLRCDEPRIEVSQRVLEQLGVSHRRRVLHRNRLAMVAMVLVAAGLLVASNGHLRRTMKRLGAIIP